jgi:Tfp pilus assembly protein PilE
MANKSTKRVICLDCLFIIFFTSIVVIIIYPYFTFKKVCASKQSIAKTFVSSTMRSQEQYYTNNNEFINSIKQPSIQNIIKNIDTKENPIEISIKVKNNIAFAYASPKLGNKVRYSYISAIAYEKSSNKFITIVCKTPELDINKLSEPTLEKGFLGMSPKFICPSHTIDC